MTSKMMQRVADGHVNIEFSVVTGQKDGQPVKEQRALDFYYDIYRTETGTFNIKYTKCEPNDPALISKFLGNEGAQKLLRGHIARNIKEQLGAKDVVIEEATGL